MKEEEYIDLYKFNFKGSYTIKKIKIKKCKENTLVIAKYPFPTIQEMTLHMDITRRSIPKSDYVLFNQRWRSSIQSAETGPGAYCGSDHEFLFTKYSSLLQKEKNSIKMKKEKFRSFRNDLNQIPTD